ncbi:hypothetical protein TNCV_4058001 [Trichonephila clavipes]|nr:hypothetical protein TNCV_4058001 [Trichonephila clavipes]
MTNYLLGASRHVHGYQNTANRARSHLKSRHCATPVFIFVIRRLRVAASLYAALSRDAEVMSAMLTVDSAASRRNVRANTGVLQICPFPD